VYCAILDLLCINSVIPRGKPNGVLRATSSAPPHNSRHVSTSQDQINHVIKPWRWLTKTVLCRRSRDDGALSVKWPWYVQTVVWRLIMPSQKEMLKCQKIMTFPVFYSALTLLYSQAAGHLSLCRAKWTHPLQSCHIPLRLVHYCPEKCASFMKMVPPWKFSDLNFIGISYVYLAYFISYRSKLSRID
jgi:hypothetical protein